MLSFTCFALYIYLESRHQSGMNQAHPMEKLNHKALVSFSVEGHGRARLNWCMLDFTFVLQRQQNRHCIRRQNVMLCYENSIIKRTL